jgi:hypothetical protein
MGNVVKESIQQEITVLQSKMQTIQQWIETHQKIDS